MQAAGVPIGDPWTEPAAAVRDRTGRTVFSIEGLHDDFVAPEHAIRSVR
jgi:hypothetical protein